MTTQVVSKAVTVRNGERSVAGSLNVACFSKEARVKRALKTGMICLGVTLVCLTIPGAHFVLVPLMLALTPFFILRTYKVTTAIVGAVTSCAACGGKLTTLSSKENYPLYETCLACQRENRISPVVA
jgi:hypothetical protein